jgi:hypothetical protein
MRRRCRARRRIVRPSSAPKDCAIVRRHAKTNQSIGAGAPDQTRRAERLRRRPARLLSPCGWPAGWLMKDQLRSGPVKLVGAAVAAAHCRRRHLWLRSRWPARSPRPGGRSMSLEGGAPTSPRRRRRPAWRANATPNRGVVGGAPHPVGSADLPGSRPARVVIHARVGGPLAAREGHPASGLAGGIRWAVHLYLPAPTDSGCVPPLFGLQTEKLYQSSGSGGRLFRLGLPAGRPPPLNHMQRDKQVFWGTAAWARAARPARAKGPVRSGTTRLALRPTIMEFGHHNRFLSRAPFWGPARRAR